MVDGSIESQILAKIEYFIGIFSVTSDYVKGDEEIIAKTTHLAL